MVLNKWRIYCNTENVWSYGWIEEGQPEPSKCFNDHTHIINPESIGIDQILGENIVKISEESGYTQGNFRMEGFEMECDVNSTTLFEFQLPYDISLLLIWFNITDINKGDIFDAFYQPNYTGSTKNELLISSTSMVTEPLFAQIINIGYNVLVKAQNSEILEDLGEVLSVDKNKNIVTFSNPVSKSYRISSDIIIRIYGIKNLHLVSEGRHSVGSGKIGGSFLTKNGKFNIKYTNKSLDISKKFYYGLEYLY